MKNNQPDAWDYVLFVLMGVLLGIGIGYEIFQYIHEQTQGSKYHKGSGNISDITPKTLTPSASSPTGAKITTTNHKPKRGDTSANTKNDPDS